MKTFDVEVSTRHTPCEVDGMGIPHVRIVVGRHAGLAGGAVELTAALHSSAEIDSAVNALKASIDRVAEQAKVFLEEQARRFRGQP
ncbi:hypothetical protein GCM10007301_20120 [Azorhizobium oxalatiphilum]|uniref:Uncharacterized protein n=1 Tax=Azorhizobium oxalatiphilum TaxID=980631 RepID=A0A917BXU3_9HYPH|nr:hypothetical protein [Azorhizobium oxalatiphilum]GGF60364.1 hypothetical protein GCM10007301_20120 [Azorhizobium oxalatiphilum]